LRCERQVEKFLIVRIGAEDGCCAVDFDSRRVRLPLLENRTSRHCVETEPGSRKHVVELGIGFCRAHRDDVPGR